MSGIAAPAIARIAVVATATHALPTSSEVAEPVSLPETDGPHQHWTGEFA